MTARVACALAAVAIVGTVMTSPAPAHGSCPPYVVPPTPEALSRLVMRDGLMIGPRRGRAPLVVHMAWMTVPVPDPVRFEIDAGDGTAVWSDPNEPGRQTHTYAQPGTYTLIARVTDRAGRVMTSRIPIEVVPAAAFDAEISARWATFKAALARNDLNRALECVTSETRNRARQALRPGSPLVASFLPHADTLTFFGKMSSVDLEYHTDFVNARAPTLVFSPDMDGVWRIDAGGWAR